MSQSSRALSIAFLIWSCASIARLLLLDDVERRFQRQRQRIGDALDRLSRHHAVVDGVLERSLRVAHLLHRVGDEPRRDGERDRDQREQLQGEANILEDVEAHAKSRLSSVRPPGRRASWGTADSEARLSALSSISICSSCVAMPSMNSSAWPPLKCGAGLMPSVAMSTTSLTLSTTMPHSRWPLAGAQRQHDDHGQRRELRRRQREAHAQIETGTMRPRRFSTPSMAFRRLR